MFGKLTHMRKRDFLAKEKKKNMKKVIFLKEHSRFSISIPSITNINKQTSTIENSDRSAKKIKI